MERSQLKSIVISVAIALVVGYAFGRWATPTKVEIKKEIVEKKVIDTEEMKRIEMERNKKLRTVTVEIVRPDGTREKTTRHVESSTVTKNTDSETKTRTETETRQTETKVVENKRPGVIISALAGVDVTNFTLPVKPIYGGHVQKSIIGPISAGAFGLSNGTCGVSLGLIF